MPVPGTTVRKKAAKKSVLGRLHRFDNAVCDELDAGVFLIGVDEVGRGSLVGPVVAGAACLTRELSAREKKALRLINDSKQLLWEQREELCAFITACDAFATALGEASKEEVDRINVHYASLLAGYRAYAALREKLACEETQTYLLLDGRAHIPDLCKSRQRAVIKGDGLSLRIAAASIVAKQYRDHMMMALASEYPGYGWETNMGYGTPEHQQAIETLGVTPLHRVNYKYVAAQLSLI